MKQKKCRYCKELFTPFNSMQSFCFKNECVYEHNKQQREKKKRKELNKLKDDDRSHWLKLAQSTFNTYIRMRDKNEPCISCQKTNIKKVNAGHYRPVGRNSALRFSEDNVHKQCEYCNTYLSGNLSDYRINLIKKIGLEKVEHLESYNEPKKWTIEELREIVEKYKFKIKTLDN